LIGDQTSRFRRLQVAKIKILHFLATTPILFREGTKMLKISFDETKRKEMATAKLKKLSLDVVNAHQLFDAKNLTSLNFGLNEETRSQLLRLDESGPLRRLISFQTTIVRGVVI
jgi:hypothetical protein